MPSHTLYLFHFVLFFVPLLNREFIVLTEVNNGIANLKTEYYGKTGPI